MCLIVSVSPESNWTQIGEDLHNGRRTILIRFVLNISSFFDISQGYLLTSFLPFLLVKVGDTCLFRHGWSSPPSGSLLGQLQLCVLYISRAHLLSIYTWILLSVFLQIVSYDGSCFTLARGWDLLHYWLLVQQGLPGVINLTGNVTMVLFWYSLLAKD